MLNPDLYENNNDWQKKDARECLEKHVKNIKWRRGAQIIDIGCGNGAVTSTILQKYVPSDFKNIVGVDISKEMVEYSNKYYGDDRISFKLMDIGGDLPTGFKGRYQHAFSFYALHWVHDQEKAFENIYNLLDTNGDCLLLFLAKSKLFDVFTVLSAKDRWNSWVVSSIGSVEHFLARYHDMKDPQEELTKIIKGAGFRNELIKTEKAFHVFPGVQRLKTFVAALNPFKVPEALLDEFGEDAIEILMDMGVTKTLEEDQNITIDLTIFTVYGQK